MSYGSPIAKALSAFGASAGADKSATATDLILRAEHNIDLLHLAGWKDNMDALRSAIGAACGFEVSAFSGRVEACESDDFILLPLSFETYRLRSRRGELPSALLSLPVDVGISVSVSHSFCVLAMSGAAVREFLRLLLPIDTGSGVFSPGRVATTSYHHCSVTLHRSVLRPDFYSLYLPSGMAQSLGEAILDVAKGFSLSCEV